MVQDWIKLTCWSCFFALTACQNMQSGTESDVEILLSSDNGQLDLSLSTLEQQNIEKARAKEFLLEARQKRKIIQPSETDELDQNIGVNIASFARGTFNDIGEKIYTRVGTKEKNSNRCLRFVSAESAQRFFLEKSGPENDFWNLDPDGDGFACQWDPTPYRNLIVNQKE